MCLVLKTTIRVDIGTVEAVHRAKKATEALGSRSEKKLSRRIFCYSLLTVLNDNHQIMRWGTHGRNWHSSFLVGGG